MRDHTGSNHALLPENTTQKVFALLMLGVIGVQSYMWCIENRQLRIQNRQLMQDKTNLAVGAVLSFGLLVVSYVPRLVKGT